MEAHRPELATMNTAVIYYSKILNVVHIYVSMKWMPMVIDSNVLGYIEAFETSVVRSIQGLCL